MNVISLFSGCGGLDLGFERAGFHIPVANEMCIRDREVIHVRAAIYCRLSEEDRDKRSFADDSASIQNQKSMLVQYAIEQGWEIYGIYSDDCLLYTSRCV